MVKPGYSRGHAFCLFREKSTMYLRETTSLFSNANHKVAKTLTSQATSQQNGFIIIPSFFYLPWRPQQELLRHRFPSGSVQQQRLSELKACPELLTSCDIPAELLPRSKRLTAFVTVLPLQPERFHPYKAYLNYHFLYTTQRLVLAKYIL